MAGRHRIARWLRPLLEAEEDQRPTRIAVRHVSVNDRHADVSSLAVADETDDEALAALAEEIEVAIQNDADGMGGTQRYLVVALRGEAQLTRLPFRAAATDDSEAGEPIDS